MIPGSTFKGCIIYLKKANPGRKPQQLFCMGALCCDLGWAAGYSPSVNDRQWCFSPLTSALRSVNKGLWILKSWVHSAGHVPWALGEKGAKNVWVNTCHAEESLFIIFPDHLLLYLVIECKTVFSFSLIVYPSLFYPHLQHIRAIWIWTKSWYLGPQNDRGCTFYSLVFSGLFYFCVYLFEPLNYLISGIYSWNMSCCEYLLHTCSGIYLNRWHARPM